MEWPISKSPRQDDRLTVHSILAFKTQTYDLEVGNTNVLGGKHILTYGGNARRNNFDITLAPTAKDRTEFGAYCQDEFFVDKFRFAVGGRVDKFGNIEDPVFSPRVSVMFKPTHGPLHPGLVQPAPSARPRSSTTTWTRTSSSRRP